jgi:hypothetical protein
MLNFLLAILVGWPAILFSVLFAGLGLFKSNYRFLVWAAIIAFPFSWYLSGFPLIRSPIFLLPVLIFCSAWAMRYGREMIAWLLGIPFFLVIILLLMSIVYGTG